LLSRLIEYRQTYVGLTQDLTETNPDLQRIKSVMEETQKQIEERVNGVLDALFTQVGVHETTYNGLTQQLEAAKAVDWEASPTYRPYFNLKRELDLEEKILDNINFRIVQETLDQALYSETSMVRITDPAEPGVGHVRPDMTLNLALGIIVGLIMGVGLAFFIEYLDTSVKTIDDVERALQAPVLGVIPQNVGALIDEGPESPHAEAYRVLRTNLLFSRKNNNTNSITVVSGGAGEGKSTTIINLATVFAQSGQRILLVDSDLRRPSLHKYLNVSNSIGLTNLLLKQNSLEEVIQTTNLPTLNFLPSGKLPSSSMGILNSLQMKEFVETVKKTYDFVFFDSPPIMGVSDASILASSVDMTLLVVQYRKYPQAMTLRAKQMVEKVGGNLLGVVLNNINISQDSYYYYYSGYYYDYYSKHDDSEGSSSEKKNGEAKKQPGDRASIDLKQKY
jgi:polysaccharide biosynthesis transport protein